MDCFIVFCRPGNGEGAWGLAGFHFSLCALCRLESGEGQSGEEKRSGKPRRGGPPGPTWEKSPTPTGRSGSGRAAGRPGLPSATRTRAPGLRKHWGLWLMRPCPSTPASSAGKRTNEPGTKAGLPPKGGQQTVLLFFFPHPSVRPGSFGLRAAPGLRQMPPRRPRGAGPGAHARAGAQKAAAARAASLAPVSVATGSRGEGPGGVGWGGCYFCRFLFLAATSPWQRCYSPRPLPGSAGARDPGRPRPLVSHLLRCRSPPHPQRRPPPAPRSIQRAPAPHPSPCSPPLSAGARGPGGRAEGGRLMGDAY